MIVRKMPIPKTYFEVFKELVDGNTSWDLPDTASLAKVLCVVESSYIRDAVSQGIIPEPRKPAWCKWHSTGIECIKCWDRPAE